jgi:hypothetical protein
MDVKIRRLFEAIKGEKNKPLGEMRREVRQHIVEAEKNIRETTEPDPDDPDNEQAVQRFRNQFRERVHVICTRSGDAAIHLHAVLDVCTIPFMPAEPTVACQCSRRCH